MKFYVKASHYYDAILYGHTGVLLNYITTMGSRYVPQPLEYDKAIP